MGGAAGAVESRSLEVFRQSFGQEDKLQETMVFSFSIEQIIEGSLEMKLPTIWTVEKQR